MVFSNAMNTLSLTRGVLDRKDVDKAAQMIANSGRLLIFGLGGSNIVAQDAFHKLIRTGIDCVMVEDYHMQLMLASQSCADCVALIFSHTGTNMDTIAIAQECANPLLQDHSGDHSARSGSPGWPTSSSRSRLPATATSRRHSQPASRSR